MNLNGNGRVALVTGGGRGIGAAIAVGLAQDGHKVVIADMRRAEAEETAATINDAGGTARAFEVDVTDSATVSGMIETVTSELGPVDVLVNNAGWDDLKPFLATDEAFWDRVLDINFKGTLRLTHAVLPGMVERQWGRIISIGSDAGRVGSSLESVYSGAKGGIIAFTKTVAREVARSGVTLNVVCPGPTDTPFMAETTSKAKDAEAVLNGMTRAIPMRRLGKPEEVAAAVRFFADESAAFITGQTLSVSGGLTMA
jgi:2-hydroxycyclohexanecarboxyl-CoA dehydrogenase